MDFELEEGVPNNSSQTTFLPLQPWNEQSYP